jgi:hypothetical protein
MKGFTAAHEGRRVRVEFVDGQIREGEVEAVCTCNQHRDCCGVVLYLSEINGPEHIAHRTLWAEVEKIKSFEVIERETE